MSRGTPVEYVLVVHNGDNFEFHNAGLLHLGDLTRTLLVPSNSSGRQQSMQVALGLVNMSLTIGGLMTKYAPMYEQILQLKQLKYRDNQISIDWLEAGQSILKDELVASSYSLKKLESAYKHFQQLAPGYIRMRPSLEEVIVKTNADIAKARAELSLMQAQITALKGEIITVMTNALSFQYTYMLLTQFGVFQCAQPLSSDNSPIVFTDAGGQKQLMDAMEQFRLAQLGNEMMSPGSTGSSYYSVANDSSDSEDDANYAAAVHRHAPALVRCQSFPPRRPYRSRRPLNTSAGQSVKPGGIFLTAMRRCKSEDCLHLKRHARFVGGGIGQEEAAEGAMPDTEKASFTL